MKNGISKRFWHRNICVGLCFLAIGLLGQLPSAVVQGPTSIGNAYAAAAAQAEMTQVDKVRHEFLDPDSKAVLVIAHRGDWRNAPENSVQAIKNCVAMGVDIVEIDIAKTKDGRIVLMHDRTLDRTTNGKGKVSDITFDELRKLRLRNGQGAVTHHQVPTLEEALDAARGNVMLNLDKAFGDFRQIHDILVKADMCDHILLKGTQPADQVKKQYGDIIDDVLYMPIIFLNKSNAAKVFDSFMQGEAPIAIEFVFPKYTPLLQDQLQRCQTRGTRPWINTLWPQYNEGHDDDAAVDDIDAAYGWVLDKGFTMIQTDRPGMLLDYLRSRGLRPHDAKQPAMAGAAQ